MLALTHDQIAAGWGYVKCGYVIGNRWAGRPQLSVTRVIDWEAPEGQPEWVVRNDRTDKVIHHCEPLDEAMRFAEATYRLEDTDDTDV